MLSIKRPARFIEDTERKKSGFLRNFVALKLGRTKKPGRLFFRSLPLSGTDAPVRPLGKMERNGNAGQNHPGTEGESGAEEMD